MTSDKFKQIIINDNPLCRCLNISKIFIQSAIANQQLLTLQSVIEQTKAGSACTCCHKVINKLLIEILEPKIIS